MIDFKQLEAFAAVVDYTSFSEAAKHLYLSQPTISAHITALENELKCKLFKRTTKTITVTKEGLHLYDYAVSILKLRRKAYEEINPENDLQIHIGVSTIPSAYLLPELIAEYNRYTNGCGTAKLPAYRDVVFSVSQSDSKGILDMLSEGCIDIGIVGMASADNRFNFEVILQDEIVIMTPYNEHFLEMKRNNAPIGELFKEPVIMREKGSGTKKEAELLLERMGLDSIMLDVRMNINDQEAVKQCVMKGIGISMISRLAAAELERDKKVLIFGMGEFSAHRNIYLVSRKDMVYSKLNYNFMQFVRDYAEEWRR